VYVYVVKPVYKGHSREPAKLVVIDRWPLFGGSEIWPLVSLWDYMICFIQIYCKLGFVYFPFIIFINKMKVTGIVVHGHASMICMK